MAVCVAEQVIADNDAPELYGPSRYDNIEFSWFALNELRVHDLDAPDRLLPGETVKLCLGVPRYIMWMERAAARRNALKLPRAIRGGSYPEENDLQVF